MDEAVRQQAEHIFKQAIEQAPEARADFLSTACGSDLTLRSEVESLLAAFDDSDDMVTRFALQAGLAMRVNEPRPERIGAYRLLEPIGEGGMGIVFRAAQDRPQRTVALKLIRQGFHSRRLKRRFELEAELLGRLQHVGIAQIYEAGAAVHDGNEQPFFAMELVEGKPIHEYANARHLDLPARLGLIIRVCEAVHHAHQKGVIHRDLKPENVLVTGEGQPKILDFGVARVIDRAPEMTAATLDGQLLGTIPYMSPEQVSGRPDEVDTRTDVYALGVLLYQLVTGQLPHKLQGLSIPQAIQAITNTDAIPAEQRNTRLPADAVTIVHKALAKERERRYDSAAALADDLRRFLKNEPIEARPATAIYQLGKFARRNRGLVVGIATVTVVLIGGVAGTTLGWFEANRQRDAARTAQQLAESEALRAATISEFLQDMLRATQPSEDRGYDITMTEMLDEAASDLERFEQQPEVEAALQLTIAQSYIGLGRAARAAPHLQAATNLYEQLGGAERKETLETRFWRMRLLKLEGRIDEAIEAGRSLLAVQRRVLGDAAPQTLLTQRELAGILVRNGDPDGAEALLNDAYAQMRETRGADHLESVDVALSLVAVLFERGQHEDAERMFRRASEQLDAAPRRMQLDIRMALANSLHSIGRHIDAEPLAREVLAARRAQHGPSHPATLRALNALGNILTKLDRFEEAEAILTESLDRRREVHGDEHPDTLRGWHNLACLALDRKQPERGIELLEPVLETRRQRIGRGQPATLASVNTLAECYAAVGRRPEAIALLEEGLEDALTELGPTSPETLQLKGRLALQYKRARRIEDAERLYLEALEARQAISGEYHEDTIQLVFNLARLYQDTRDAERAETFFLRALQARRKLHRPLDRRIGETAHALAVLYRWQKRYDEALPLHVEKHETEVKHRPDHTERWNSLSNVGYGHMLLGQHAEAIEPFAQAARELQRRMGKHWWVATQYNLLGGCLLETGQLEAAEQALLQGLELAQAASGSRATSQVQRAARELVKLYERMDQPERAAEYQRLAEPEGEP